MKKKFCKEVHVRDLKVGDRVLVRNRGEQQKHYIGYVESINDMTDGGVCAYLDIRWRGLRKAEPFWANEKRPIPASQKFQLVFPFSELFLTNMKLHEACVKAGLPLIGSTEYFDIPF